MPTRQIGRDATTGQFIPVDIARNNPGGAVVETIKIPAPKPPRKKRKK